MIARVFDTFCGAGGLSLGFEQSSFVVAAAVDTDFDSTETFARHHPRAEVFLGDVDDVRLGTGMVDVVIGGPPCQPWSHGGKQLGPDDERDGWPRFVRAVARTAPAAFVAENVPGFLSSPHATTVVDQLSALGYVLGWHILDAAHFGVAQHRRRLFIVGLRAGTGMRFEWPTPSATVTPVAALGFGETPIGQPNNAIVTYSKVANLRSSPYAGHLVNGGGRPIDLARPAPTVLASAAGNKAPWLDIEDVMPKYHAELTAGGPVRSGIVAGARRLTDVELAMLQGFPPDYGFYGSRSSRVRQIGNAVPPPLARAIARQLSLAITQRKYA